MMRNSKVALLGLALITTAASAQQKVQWDSKFNIPIAPTGLVHRPLLAPVGPGLRLLGAAFSLWTAGRTPGCAIMD